MDNEVKKDLYRSKAVAKFTHYREGKLFYTVEIFGALHQFPIHTTEKTKGTVNFIDEEAGVDVNIEYDTIQLSDDLKGADFESEVKGSTLIRWIQKAIKNEELIKLEA